MDTIFLNDLRIETIVGIFAWERKMPQIVSIDLEMATDVSVAAKTEKIEDCLDYKAVTKSVRTLVVEKQFQLVETMADSIANIIMEEFAVPWVKVSVHKPGAIRGAKDVGITVERGSR